MAVSMLSMALNGVPGARQGFTVDLSAIFLYDQQPFIDARQRELAKLERLHGHAPLLL
jgi:hypothetical protein